MTIGYYPGCTLKSKAKNLEDSALACLDALGVGYRELERWNCCGAVFSLSDDDVIHHIAPVRDLVRAKDAGYDRVTTLCSMCYNTLARANLLMRSNAEKRDTINRFMEEESDYAGEVEVVHYLDLLRTEVGWDRLAAAVKKPLEGLRVAPYYGCTLLRPEAVAIESPAHPRLMADFLTALGATPVEFPDATTCCSSYQIVADEKAAFGPISRILTSAQAAGVEALVLSCPVCEYNLGLRQSDVRAEHPGLSEIPTYYFTQLMAVALGLPQEKLGLELNDKSAADLLCARKLVAVG